MNDWDELMSDPEGQKIFEEEYNRIMKHAPEAIDWLLENCKDARWDLVARAHNILASGFKEKMADE